MTTMPPTKLKPVGHTLSNDIADQAPIDRFAADHDADTEHGDETGVVRLDPSASRLKLGLTPIQRLH